MSSKTEQAVVKKPILPPNENGKSPLSINMDQVRDNIAAEEAAADSKKLSELNNRVVNLHSLKGGLNSIDAYVEPKSPINEIIQNQ